MCNSLHIMSNPHWLEERLSACNSPPSSPGMGARQTRAFCGGLWVTLVTFPEGSDLLRSLDLKNY